MDRSEWERVQDLFHQVADLVEAELADQPRVLGTMLDHVGSIYRTMADYPQAERLLVRALEGRSRAALQGARTV